MAGFGAGVMYSLVRGDREPVTVISFGVVYALLSGGRWKVLGDHLLLHFPFTQDMLYVKIWIYIYMPLNCQMNKMNIDVVITLNVHALKVTPNSRFC